MTVTVLIESSEDCVAFGKVAEEMMDEGNPDDISYIFRVAGIDMLTHCPAMRHTETVESCLF